MVLASAAQLSTNVGVLQDLTSDNSNVYWITENAVLAVPGTGGSIATLAAGENKAVSMALGNGMVYWIEQICCTGVRPSRIKQVPIVSGPTSVVVDGFFAADALTVAGPNLIWSEGAYGIYSKYGRIASVPTIGGSVATLASGVETDAPRFSIFGQNMYLAEGGSIKQLPISGGFPEAFYLGSTGSTSNVVSDGTNLYWGAFDTIRKKSLTGGPIVDLAIGDVTALALANDTLYWIENSRSIKKMSTAGGPITTILAGADGLTWLLADETTVYFVQGGPTASGLKSIPINGGSVVPLALGIAISGPDDLVQDATHLYWTSFSSVSKIPKGGGSVVSYEQLVKFSGGGIAVDDSSVYWIRDGILWKVTPK